MLVKWPWLHTTTILAGVLPFSIILFLPFPTTSAACRLTTSNSIYNWFKLYLNSYLTKAKTFCFLQLFIAPANDHMVLTLKSYVCLRTTQYLLCVSNLLSRTWLKKKWEFQIFVPFLDLCTNCTLLISMQ